ncbi:MAG: hypothetical protein VX768_00435 [Planctomycetota bacterium]|nr:hypothetical protein [Planctomycetota bacterium]
MRKSTTVFILASLLVVLGGCAPLQLPRIDPSGNRLFLPGNAQFSQPYRPVPAFASPPAPAPCPLPGVAPRNAAMPRFAQPVAPGVPAAANPIPTLPKPRILPPAPEFTLPGKAGRIILTPDEIVAPVGSEVVVMAGICGNDGHYVIQQPIEWMLSQESVGNMVTVANSRNQLISKVIGPNSKKISTGFAKTVTSSSRERITKGTPSPGDDVFVGKGQTWVTLTSPSEGTSHLTCVAPQAEGWDRRRSAARIHWLDARWQLPSDLSANNGQTVELPVVLTRSNGEPIPGWQVSYEIVGGTNAGLLPSGSQKADLTSNSLGQSSIGIRQLANGPANAQVRVRVVRPGTPYGSSRQLTVVDQVVNVRWTAPALSIEIVGPKNVGRDAEFTYRVNITNPGDAVARNAVLNLDSIDPKLEILSRQPEGKVVGGNIQWNLGNIRPGQVPLSIDLKLKAFRAGKTVTCFSVGSVEDNLPPVKACMESTVSVPCIGLKINGPTEAQVGQTVTYTLRIENQCEQPLSGIRLIANYDSGLNFPGQPSPISQKLNQQIEFGFYKELDISFEVTRPGRQCFTIDVTSNDGSKARIQQCVQVSESPAPSASISIDGPAIGSVMDQNQRYVIDVKNTGNVPLTGVEVSVSFDKSFSPQNAQEGFRRRGTDEIYWQLDRIEVGEIIPLAIEHQLLLESDNAINIVRITSREGVDERDQVRTVIRPQRRELNPPGRGPLTNSLQIKGLVLTSPVNPADDAEISIRLLNDRPPREFEEMVEVFIDVPNELKFKSGPRDRKIKVISEGEVSTYAVEPILALRGSQPMDLKFVFSPSRPDQSYDLVVRARSKQTPQPVESKLQVIITK